MVGQILRRVGLGQRSLGRRLRLESVSVRLVRPRWLLCRPTRLTREFAKSRRKLLARSSDCFPRQTLFLLQHRHPRQHFVGRYYPVHRNRVTASSRTGQSQRSGAAGAANHEHFASFNDLTAREAIPFVFKRMPLPIAVQPLQNLQFLRAGELDGGQKRHSDGESQMHFPVQSGERLIQL